MKLLFTKRSGLVGSKLIMWATGEDCSHFQILFESPRGGICFEAEYLGLQIRFFNEYVRSGMVVVHEIDVPISVEREDTIWDAIVDRYDGRPYDWLGFIYFGWRCLLRKVFAIPYPATNPWSRSDQFFCTELGKVLPHDVVPLEVLSMDFGFMTPQRLYNLIISAKTESK